jgi:hypothetical protein
MNSTTRRFGETQALREVFGLTNSRCADQVQPHQSRDLRIVQRTVATAPRPVSAPLLITLTSKHLTNGVSAGGWRGEQLRPLTLLTPK